MLELGGQLSVLLGNPVSDLENLLTWSEAELLRVTSGETEMQHTRAQVETQLHEQFNFLTLGEPDSTLPSQHLRPGDILPLHWLR